MKSFRLYSETPKPPQRYASEFSAEELLRLREAFRPLAERYRRYMRVAYIVIGIALALLLSGFVFSKTRDSRLIGGFFICWLTLMFIAVLSPVPECPACHNRLDRSFGAFCPECGAHALQAKSWLRAECSSCGRAMQRGRGRGYSIRACTHCGVMLDEEGL